MAKRGKTNNEPCRGNKMVWQSSELNTRYQQFFRTQLIQLALARFRWVNLPQTCNARYLETQLCFNGMATIAAPDGTNVYLSLKASPSNINMYGDASAWRAIGDNGTNFTCTHRNGVMVYDNMLRSSIAGTFTLLAYDMADIIRTKQINRMHVKTPLILVGDQAYKQQMVNVFKQIAGNEPGVIATKGFNNIEAQAIQTGVPYYGTELQDDLMNTWNMAFTFLGINNLPFKSERQTADEIKDYGEPCELLSLNPLSCRREACDKFNDLHMVRVWGKETPKPLQCVWNEDVESNAYNFMHDVEKLMEGDKQ